MLKSEFYNCDNMEFMAKFPDGHFELAIVDPPYGINADKGIGGSLRNNISSGKIHGGNWDSAVPTQEYFNELFRVSKNQIIWGGNYFNLPPSQYFAIWDKGETMYGRDFAECEYAWIRAGGTRILKKSPNQLDRIHPTQKPVRLYEWLLSNYAKEGDKILDTHVGSASSRIACHNLKFDFFGCELDEDYFKQAEQRYQEHIRQETLF